MRVGVIGAGRIGAFHARNLKGLPGVAGLALVDQDPQLVEGLARELGASAFSSIGRLIDDGVDAVVIAASTASHVELVQAAVEAGIPVFCEKPLALDLETTDHMAKLVSDAPI